MKWIEITVFTTDEGAEIVTGALGAAGLSGFSIEESKAAAMRFLNESALYWDFADMSTIGTDTPCVKTYLADLPENECILSRAREAVERLASLDTGLDLGTLEIRTVRVDDEDWANNWKKYYKPLKIGSRLLVLPSWEDMIESDGRTVLRLDPGMAFGTGAHHTTRMCLEFLEETVHAGDTMLDLGCGSGILSIASILLGAKSAVAVDIDPIAEKIAFENAAMNGVTGEKYRVEIGDVLTDQALQTRILKTYDVVAANIVADVIVRLAPFAKCCCKHGAPFIASGIIGERKDEVLARLAEVGFVAERVIESEDWVAILSRG